MEAVKYDRPQIQRLRGLISLAGTASGCQLWLGRVDADGYGRITIAGADHLAHQLVLEIDIERRLADTEIAHQTCGEKLCCASRHLIVAAKRGHLRDVAATATSLSRWGGAE